RSLRQGGARDRRQPGPWLSDGQGVRATRRRHLHHQPKDRLLREGSRGSEGPGPARRDLCLQRRNWNELDGLVDAAYKAFGKVDILVNNAGSSPLAPSSLETPEALFDRKIGRA